MAKNVIVGWPQSQMIREKQGFYENCMLINSIEGVLSYGADAFLVDKDWYDKFFNGELEDMTEEEEYFVYQSKWAYVYEAFKEVFGESYDKFN